MSDKLWSGRFSKPLQAMVEEFTASISVDYKLARYDILGSLAHVKMLTKCGVLSQTEGHILQGGLRDIYSNILANKVVFKVADEDIHMNIERLLCQSVGEVAKKLHTARSRNDQVAVDTHLYLRHQLIVVVDLLTHLQKVLVQQAECYQDVIMPGYTHLQRAQPVRLAHHFLAYAAMFARDSERLMEGWRRVNISPLGACALAGTGFPTDPVYTAELLAFDGLYLNSMDAVSDRDYVIEFLASATLIMSHLSRLCEELVLWSSQEFNFISLDDAYCTGSSIMPQKKNPDVPELVRGKTGRVYGALISLLTTLKSLPLAYNKDLQEDKFPLFDTVDTLHGCLSVFIPLLETMRVHADKMRMAVEEGFLNATDLADYLARCGVPFREAHHIAGKIVLYCIEKQCRLEQLPLDELQQFSLHFAEDIFAALTIENTVEARNSLTGSAMPAIQRQIAMTKEKLQLQQKWVENKFQLLAGVEESLFTIRFSSLSQAD